MNRRSSRLVLQEVSDLWRADPLHPANVSGSFSHREFAAALQHLKPGKAPEPDSICQELIIHAGAGLKSWLRGFLFCCLHHLKIPKIWRRALVVAVPKPSKPVEDPRSFYIIYLHISYIRNSYIQFTKMLFDFGTFTNQTVLICYIRIPDMFESKNFTSFWNNYKSSCSDISYQNF